MPTLIHLGPKEKFSFHKIFFFLSQLALKEYLSGFFTYLTSVNWDALESCFHDKHVLSLENKNSFNLPHPNRVCSVIRLTIDHFQKMSGHTVRKFGIVNMHVQLY
jgi:hypothetical protein